MYEKYVLKKMKYNIDKQDLDKKKKNRRCWKQNTIG